MMVTTSPIVPSSRIVVIAFVIVFAMAVAILTVGSIYDPATNRHFRRIPR